MRKRIFFTAIGILLTIGMFGGVHAGETLKIGVIQLLEHPDHVVMREAFLKSMEKKGYDVEAVVFIADSPKHPKAYASMGAEKAKEMASDGVKLFYSTAMYHAVKGSTGDVPIVDAAFLSPILMNNAAMKDGKIFCTGNATGTYLSYPLKEIARFVKEVIPNATKLAYVHHPKSPVSRPLKEVEVAFGEIGIEVISCPFTTREGVIQALEKAKAENAQAAFLTNDVPVLGQEKNAIDFSLNNGLPTVFGNIPAVREGALAGIQWNWARAGEMCAEKADAVLHGQSPREIAIEMPDEFKIGINVKTAQRFKLEVPYEWLEAASDVVD